MTTAPYTVEDGIVYPDCDGEPMSDNSLQWDWMVKIVCELRVMFAGRQILVAGNLLWYPLKGQPKVRAAPDAFVVFGRPPGYRGSYIQWKEDDRPLNVVFEVLSPGNTPTEMALKFEFYERHGADEYYVIDPERKGVTGYVRDGDRFRGSRTCKASEARCSAFASRSRTRICFYSRPKAGSS